ncbi:MAG: helix-turn-helix transcriptional regulator [Acidimicrobiia bacterium]|nr:helix-turn-helix transcriptional regulator [Acidimicrobiia bacterium]
MYGAFVRAVRQSRGLTQAQLADISGISQPNLSAVEHDRRTPSTDTLNRLVVSCGYELAAVAGERVIHCDLPQNGWFPDEDLPGPVDGDPVDEAPALAPDATVEQRLQAIDAVLDVADERVR